MEPTIKSAVSELRQTLDKHRKGHGIGYNSYLDEQLIDKALALCELIEKASLGEIEWGSVEFDTGALAEISFDDNEREFIGKRGQLYFSPEPSEETK